MKHFLTSVLIFILVQTNLKAIAQTVRLSGTIKNEKNEGISFATVLLQLAKDSSLIKAENATENGGFKITNIKPDRYFITISSVGYQKYNSTVLILENENLNLTDIVLKNANDLKGITVNAQKPLIEVRADKTVFNVQGSISATGTTAFEVLRKAPGVVIDNNENVILEGKTGVRIYIDGKPSVLSGQNLNDFLKSLQASDIEALEILLSRQQDMTLPEMQV
jgi:iron complex outermembrane recepter protein